MPEASKKGFGERPMCGIAGLICFDSDCGGQLHESLVRAMCELTAHRGPDDSGMLSRGRFALGSQRLSIIDLSPAGHMPMSDASGRWWITYNGEVYNFETVREELLRLGHSFRSRTDTEVILHAYMEWGEECIDRFVGMFAFAILDTQRGEVVLVRDRYGVKPLYYARSGPHLLFASEIKALMRTARAAAGRPSQPARMVALPQRRCPDAGDPRRGRPCRPAGPGRPNQRRRDDRRSSTTRRSVMSARSTYRHHQAARLEDVIDEIDAIAERSGSAAAGERRAGRHLAERRSRFQPGHLDRSQVHARSDRLPRLGRRLSESGRAPARRGADQALGLPLVPFSLTGEIFRRELPRVVYFSDLPLTHPNSVAYYLICKVAREHGVIVLLSGEGADELFGGYSWNYRRKGMLLRLEPLLGRVPAEAIRLAGRYWSTARPACRSAVIASGTPCRRRST